MVYNLIESREVIVVVVMERFLEVSFMDDSQRGHCANSANI
jgi:hypothetical protein